MLHNVHGDDGVDAGYREHLGCPDPYCCECECRACKRAWSALDRPTSRSCPLHATKIERDEAEAVRKERWESERKEKLLRDKKIQRQQRERAEKEILMDLVVKFQKILKE